MHLLAKDGKKSEKIKYLGEVKLITNDQDDNNFTSSFSFIFFYSRHLGSHLLTICVKLYDLGSSVQAIGLSWSLSLYLMWKMGRPYIFSQSQKKRIDTHVHNIITCT